MLLQIKDDNNNWVQIPAVIDDDKVLKRTVITYTTSLDDVAIFDFIDSLDNVVALTVREGLIEKTTSDKNANMWSYIKGMETKYKDYAVRDVTNRAYVGYIHSKVLNNGTKAANNSVDTSGAVRNSYFESESYDGYHTWYLGLSKDEKHLKMIYVESIQNTYTSSPTIECYCASDSGGHGISIPNFGRIEILHY